MEHEPLTRTIIGRAMAVHRALGPGHYEGIYQAALAMELREAGLSVALECPLRVTYRGVDLGEFLADCFVDGRVLVELKAVRALGPAQERQLLQYLAATGVSVGLLINFGGPKLEFRRRTREYARKGPAPFRKGEGQDSK